MLSKYGILYITPTGKEIPVESANTFIKRFLGLMGRKKSNYGLLLYPCNSIHTLFMRYMLDAIYLDINNRIIAIKHFIKPFRTTAPVRGAVKVLEFPSSLGATELLTVGSIIELTDI